VQEPELRSDGPDDGTRLEFAGENAHSAAQPAILSDPSAIVVTVRIV
jgi:hypothetical protein